MFFNKNKLPDAVELPFNWAVDYCDGNYLTEYNTSNGSNIKNDFYSINQSHSTRFGLYGQGMKFFFENSDGSFYLTGRRIDIAYRVNGENYVLTSNDNKKDFITYKQAYTVYNNRGGQQKSNIESINFGYKTLYERDDIKLFFQPIVVLPINKSAYLEVKLTSSVDLDGDIVFMSRGKEIESFDAPLEANMSGQLNWTIKT